MKTINQVVRMTGTAAERATLVDKDVDDNTILEFTETDTGDKYEWDGNSWIQISSNGAAHVTEKPSEQVLVDNTGIYLYTGYAAFGVATSTAGWQVFRQAFTAGGLGEMIPADGDVLYNNIWDNRASLTYPAGV